MDNDRRRDWAPELPLRTPRLLLREHRMTDLDDLALFHGDERTVRYLPWPVRSRDDTRTALLKKLEQHCAPAEGDWLVLAIEEIATGQVIGEVDLKRGADGQADLGYVVRRDREGLGLASEAVRELLRLATEDLGVTTIDAHIVPGNRASERFAERLGFVRHPEGDVDDTEDPTLAYRRSSA
ncbi:GNAT family N-acetyltransferase [Labedella populi]|nr:GNAT family N-acetyltransferase [Labedella populi]